MHVRLTSRALAILRHCLCHAIQRTWPISAIKRAAAKPLPICVSQRRAHTAASAQRVYWHAHRCGESAEHTASPYCAVRRGSVRDVEYLGRGDELMLREVEGERRKRWSLSAVLMELGRGDGSECARK